MFASFFLPKSKRGVARCSACGRDTPGLLEVRKTSKFPLGALSLHLFLWAHKEID